MFIYSPLRNTRNTPNTKYTWVPGHIFVWPKKIVRENSAANGVVKRWEVHIAVNTKGAINNELRKMGREVAWTSGDDLIPSDILNGGVSRVGGTERGSDVAEDCKRRRF